MYISEILKQKWVIPTAIGAAGVATGFGVGLLVGRKTAPVIERVMLLDSNDEAADMYLDKTPPDEDEQLVLQEQFHDDENDALESQVITPIEEDEEEPQLVNVFATAETEWDENYESQNRVDGEPYIISVDEFIANEDEWQQETMTYYAGDDIVADQNDAPIYNHNGIMGPLRFGHGSGDANVVYIRNPTIRMEWEVLRHTGKFEEELAGLSIESEYADQDLKHSFNRKFRDD